MRLAVGADLLPDVILASTIRLFLLWGLDAVFWVTIIYVVISWVNPHAPFAPAVAMLLRPLLAPIQRVVPDGRRFRSVAHGAADRLFTSCASSSCGLRGAPLSPGAVTERFAEALGDRRAVDARVILAAAGFDLQ
jgi:hypothetical protein